MNNTEEIIKTKLEIVWKEEIKKYYSNAKANNDNPQGFVLGGQPGAGKSNLIQKIGNRLDKNVIVINGDDFRKFHPDYEILQKTYGKDAPKYTAEFAGKMTEAILYKAIEEKYHIIIEGTFRSSETPINK